MFSDNCVFADSARGQIMDATSWYRLAGFVFIYALIQMLSVVRRYF